jgi:hypothetical protein
MLQTTWLKTSVLKGSLLSVVSSSCTMCGCGERAILRIVIIITIISHTIHPTCEFSLLEEDRIWPWDGHYKSILLPADEEIIGSLWCQLKVCAIESARSAHPCCYGASVGFRKGLLCGSCVIHKSSISSWISCAVYPYWVYCRSVGSSDAWCPGSLSPRKALFQVKYES